MGDRANFVFEQADGDKIWLYGHWAGHEMMAKLASAIRAAEPRWTDETYATRIAISQLIGDDWSQELSWGISTYLTDNEHSIPVVNWSEQTVTLHEEDRTSPYGLGEVKFTMGLPSFINKFAKHLVAT